MPKNSYFQSSALTKCKYYYTRKLIVDPDSFQKVAKFGLTKICLANLMKSQDKKIQGKETTSSEIRKLSDAELEKTKSYLLDWNYISRSPFLKDLRKEFIRYGGLSPKKWNAIWKRIEDPLPPKPVCLCLIIISLFYRALACFSVPENSGQKRSEENSSPQGPESKYVDIDPFVSALLDINEESIATIKKEQGEKVAEVVTDIAKQARQRHFVSKKQLVYVGRALVRSNPNLFEREQPKKYKDES
ncbi:hypothetical protein RFI_10569 [Reticulomyxa filosa]|uniref:Uncharacterized protein n=1 Tax=Reticulomyxa filosa TaxID=46433 RepID=X6NLH6_RETFI|nr:hypothetical protein RFI_10569 [Reticulomyxa filosa]|eukprot:ETO26569.1 hypothetical protein RFI_10569 [Reticulomyxa filosa]